MHRRITMTFEFRRPDHTQRQQIWRRQLPDKIQRTSDVDINLLALKYELSGGYIRNAVQAALSRSVYLLKEEISPPPQLPPQLPIPPPKPTPPPLLLSFLFVLD